MKILEVKALRIPEVKVIRFARFCDHRGYFTEHYRKSDFETHAEMAFLRGVSFLQANESRSKKGTVRGLHFQWNPYMGKLVRALNGRLIDMVLDIRKGSPNYGKIVCYDMPSRPDMDYGQWIWVPPGFAHGTLFPEDTTIEYFCSGQYSPGCEGGVSPLSADIDWSLCEPKLQKMFKEIADGGLLITDKDRNAPDVAGWTKDERSDNFIYGQL